MKLVRELVCPTFLFLFFLLVLEEIAMFGISIIIYKDPINNTKEKINQISFQANLDSAVLLKKALIRKYNQCTTDLLYIGKHMMHLLNKSGPSVSSSSVYLNSFNNCFQKESSNTNLQIPPFYNSTTDTNNYIEYFSNDIPRGTEEDDIINYLFQKEYLNKISKKESNQTSSFTEDPRVACYAISMFKSIFIKNFILEHLGMTIRRFVLLIDKFAYVYPPETFKNLLLNEVMPNCDTNLPINDNWACVHRLLTDNVVKFTKPKLVNGLVTLAACIKLDQITNGTPVVCADVILSYYLSKFIYNKDVIQQALFNYDSNGPNPLEVFFTNEPDLKGDINKVFESSALNKYQLTDLSRDSNKFTFFHLLYYSLLNKTTTLYPHLPEPDLDQIIIEYELIVDKIKREIAKIELLFESRKSSKCDSNDLYYLIRNFSMNKTFLSDEETEPMISIDSYQFILTPIVIDYLGINTSTFLSTYPACKSKILFYSITAVKYIPETKANWLLDILFYKIIKLSLFYLGLLGALAMIFNIITQLYASFLLRSISKIKDEISTFNAEDALSEEKKMTTVSKLAVNIETAMLEDIFSMLKNVIIFKRALSNLDFENQKESYEQLVNNINDRDAKEVCMFILGYSNFKQQKYSQAIYNFNYILEGLQLKEAMKLNSNEQLDSQIKEILKRSADVSYVNYFTFFQGNNETILPLLKIRQLSQEIYYLCGLALLQASQEGQEEKPTINSLSIQDPIEYFIKARDINHNLEINLIKELFNMIMISRCYNKSGEYNKSMQNLSETLLLFNDLQKKINVNVNKDIDPKVLLFSNNAIFHSIMLEISITAYMNQMYYLAGWIVNKIFDTSIFLIDPVHLSASNLMINILQKILQLIDDKQKTSINKLTDKKRALFEERLRFYQKIAIRLQRKKKNKPNKKANRGRKEDCSSLIRSYCFNNIPKAGNAPIASNVFNELVLCMSEKIFKIFNGPELKDIILKYLSKNFLCDDTFSYIQFALDGKRTYSIVREKMKTFIEKLKNEKTIFKQSEFNTSQNNPNQKFTGFYSILETALNCIEFPNEGDNMILMFINAKDIRFTSKRQCSEIVRLLNSSCCSLILFSFEDDLPDQKLEKLKAFLSCLVEGVFIQVKNYQVIKQVFQSLGSIQRYYNLNDFSFENIDYII